MNSRLKIVWKRTSPRTGSSQAWGSIELRCVTTGLDGLTNAPIDSINPNDGTTTVPVRHPTGHMAEAVTVPAEHVPGQLKHSVDFYGLMFVSLGSIIGSGWLLAAGILALLALIYAELGAAYPVAGGGGRFAYSPA